MLHRLRSVTTLYLALLAAAPAAALQAPEHRCVPHIMSASEVRHALDEARLGNLEPIDALLARPAFRGAERFLLQAQRSAALLREAQAVEALRSYFAAGDKDPERLSRAHSIGAEIAFFHGRYQAAADHAGRYLATAQGQNERTTDGMRRLKRISEVLAREPSLRVDHPGSGRERTVVRDAVGLLRAPIGADAGEEQAVIDTGANLSVASVSAARRMGLREIQGEAAVGNSLGNGVAVRLAVADRLEVAGAVLRNVVFLVMEDEALTFPVPGGYRIDTIIGLPVLRALGRLRFGPGQTLRIEPSSDGENGPPNLRVVGSDLYAVVTLGGREHPLFFDTGANASSVSLRFMTEHPELRMSEGGLSSRAGAGAVAQVRRHRVERVPIQIGKALAVAEALNVEAEPAPGDEQRYGVLGVDLLRRFDTVIIDFRRMRLEVVR